MCPLIAEIGKRFQSLHPGVRVEVQCGGSGRGVSDALSGRADIGMVSRTLTDKEKNLYSFPMARDGVSIILHKSNPVKSLSDAQIVTIYTGKITNWKKAGGRDAPITVINAKKSYSSAELFVHYFKIDYDDIKAAMVAGDNPTRITAIIDNPNAIAYVSSGEAERKAASGGQIKLLPIHNVTPTNRNIITGNYPITRPLMLVTNRLPSGMAKAFIDFCLSSSVVDIIERYDLFPMKTNTIREIYKAFLLKTVACINRFTLKFILFIGFAVVIASGLPVVLLTEWTSSQAISTMAWLHEADMEISNLSLKSNAAMINARRNEKDFLLTYNEFGFSEAKSRYIMRVLTGLDDIKENIKNIRILANDSAITQQTQEVEQAIENIRRSYYMVGKYGVLGSYTGIAGAMRGKVMKRSC